jgi:Raf kinase inhibitor-like YbhB/YbcL family protein
MNKTSALFASTMCSFVLSACNETSSVSTNTAQNSFVLQSTDMIDGGKLPVTYTCDGQSINPPLNWSGAPEGTQYYALTLKHSAPEGMHWYWTLYNIDAKKTQINSGEIIDNQTAILGTNNMNDLPEYAPPCSQGPGPKSYAFTVYALTYQIDLDSSIDSDTLISTIQEKSIASAEMTVTYERNANLQKSPAKSDNTDSSSISMTERCTTIKKSINEAGFAQNVEVNCDDDYAYVSSSTYPDHDMMNGITGTNEQIPVPAQGYAAPIKLTPHKAKEVTTIDAALGVAVNGVPIYDYSSQGELSLDTYDKAHDTLATGQLDNCGGHAGRGDDYHYHVSPTCMIDTMKNKSDKAIIGWAYDGYPLYGNNNPDGSEIPTGQLDVCNGQDDATFGYRYHTSTTPPYIFQCLVGEVDKDILPRVAPMKGDNESIRADLKPPVEGVENLTHTIEKDGTRSMTYSYKGNQYFTTYSPSKQKAGCYDFKQKTITANGQLESGTFCRDSGSDQKPPTTSNNTSHNLKLEAWADNWFSAYIGDKLLVEDSVPITTERSFNAETVDFTATYPIQLNFIIKDFKQNDTGLEYIGAKNQQMGDGGFIMQVTDTDTNQIVAVSNQLLKCDVLHQAPLDKTCEQEANPIAGEAPCDFLAKDAPDNWLQANFDDSSWSNATEHSAQEVGPKDGYDQINWDKDAKLIWGADLESDNTLICRMTIEQPNAHKDN